MRRSLVTAALTVVFATASLAFAAVASAGVPLGNSCTSDSAAGNQIVLDPATSTAASDGVVVRWGYGLAETFTDVQGRRLVVLQRSAEPSQWDVISVSSPLFNGYDDGGVAEASTRAPIAAGQVIGVWATGMYVPTCTTTSDSMLYLSIASLPTSGLSRTEHATTNTTSAVFATVEPDSDKDGYGDETQDKCPQSAALQIACPVLSISQRLSASKTAITITAAASLDASLTATATVKLPRRGSKKAANVSFASTATAFAAGQLSTIKLKLPSRVKSALAARKKSKKLKFNVTLTGNGLANAASSVKSISLPGTKKEKKAKP